MLYVPEHKFTEEGSNTFNIFFTLIFKKSELHPLNQNYGQTYYVIYLLNIVGVCVCVSPILTF